MTQTEREARVKELYNQMASEIMQQITDMRRRNLSSSAYDVCTMYVVHRLAEILQKLEEHGIK